MSDTQARPLAGVRVVELGGIGPGPHACVMLADLGAEVIRIDRPHHVNVQGLRPGEPAMRGRRLTVADLKSEADRARVRELIDQCDVLVEGNRPGVTERLGLGPEDCRATNDRLIYVRATGWGQTGPWAQSPGHDINYLSLTGALASMGRRDQEPIVPLNLVADFGGGSMLAVIGVLTALVERSNSGRGQVVDVAMMDGVSILMQHFYSLWAAGAWKAGREANRLDGGAPFYRTYRCADDGYLAVGALEPQFYAGLVEGMGLDLSTLPDRADDSNWAELHSIFATTFASRTRDEWISVFPDGAECVTPVLEIDEAITHPQIRHRKVVEPRDGSVVAGGAPQLSRSGSGAAAVDATIYPLAGMTFTSRD